MLLHIHAIELTEKPYELKIGFSNQEWRLINLKYHLWGEAFTPLLDLAVFNQVKVDPESETITWPNGADFAPIFLYEQGIPIQYNSVI